MENKITAKKGNIYYTITLVMCAIVLNLLLPRLVGHLGWPIYLDSIGTVAAAALGGFIPGIVTGFATNVCNNFFDSVSIYYSIISILIAICTGWFVNKNKLNKVSGVIELIFALSLIGGGLGSLVTWFMYGPNTDDFSVKGMAIFENWGANAFVAHVLFSTVLDVLDKTITVLTVVIILKLLPKDTIEYTWRKGWRQTPIPKDELKQMQKMTYRGTALRIKIALILIMTSLAVAVSLTWVSYMLFTQYTHDMNVKEAHTTASFAASAIDPDMVDQYIEEGEKAPGYTETEKLLYGIRDSCPDIEYLYVYQIREDGCHVVFDLDTDELEGGAPGDLVPFDESFTEYIPALLAGEPIEPMESNDTYGWLLTDYEPVYDADGNCVCYAAADIKVQDIVSYQRGFLIKVIAVFLGFFFLVFAIALYLSKYHIVLPINSMAASARAFATEKDSIEGVEEGVERIRELKIDTGEEVEELYQALCAMCEDIIHRMKNMKRQAETINEMQSGLILVMADMVESRDANTGDHIHKTAAYARIVADGLKRKGYYADQLTDKYISDIQSSAPLHDVGKINVSDTILNKPGKLTDEEFEIMKTHTTAGRMILEQASSKVRGESYLKEAINMAAYHHEKWNGKGYPEGLKGEEIPLSARIMAIADVFDALASKRVYKPAMPFEKALSIIEEEAGQHFDPKCVEAFLDSIDEVRRVHEEVTGTALEDI